LTVQYSKTIMRSWQRSRARF